MSSHAEPTELDYGLDYQGRARFYGIYSATVLAGDDPLKRNRIRVQIPQVHGLAKSAWAKACLPVTDNSYHPDHLAHTAAQVAELLTNHSATITTSSVNDGGTGSSAHSHTVTVNLAHAGNTGKLTHPHTTAKSMVTSPYTVNAPTASTDSQEKSQYTTASGLTAPDGTKNPEHTFHRTVPYAGQLVWVMFEAGDPEWPVWVGVQS